jgi:hypothetical protein
MFTIFSEKVEGHLTSMVAKWSGNPNSTTSVDV